jgi:peptidoglycan/LPS O-acetylase OafA/YrhL
MTEAVLARTRDAAPDALKPPPGNPRFPLFDSLRGLAALAVVLTHVGLASGANGSAVYGALTARLDVGVTMFFVLSGFLLYRPFVAARLEDRPAPRVRDYARRRVLRIVPAYWLALTALAIWPGLLFSGPRWSYYAFVQNYDLAWVLGGLGQAWSLAVEASFYVLLPLYALVLARLTRGRGPSGTARVEIGALALLAAASIALRWRVHHTDTHTVLLFTILGTFFWFALGMGLAVASAALSGRERMPGPVRLVERAPLVPWLAAAALFALMSYTFGLPKGLFGVRSGAQFLGEHLVYGTVSFLFVLPAVWGDARGGLPRRVLGLRPIAWLGLVSYGLFLWHARWVEWLTAEGAGDWLSWIGSPFLVMLVCVLGISLACAAASYYVVERPLLRFKDGFRRRQREKASNTSAATATQWAPTRSSG